MSASFLQSATLVPIATFAKHTCHPIWIPRQVCAQDHFGITHHAYKLHIHVVDTLEEKLQYFCNLSFEAGVRQIGNLH